MSIPRAGMIARTGTRCVVIKEEISDPAHKGMMVVETGDGQQYYILKDMFIPDKGRL